VGENSMVEYLNFSYWLFQPQAWIILGITLVIADIFLGYGLFILPFGISAFIISAIIFADKHVYIKEINVLENWKDVLIYYSAISIISIFIIKKLFQKKLSKQSDINDY
jgi:membrane protein implicated in regulation of membrane protease activity